MKKEDERKKEERKNLHYSYKELKKLNDNKKQDYIDKILEEDS